MSPFSAFETWSDLAALADGRVAGWLRFAADAVTPEERAGRDAVAEAGTAGRQGSNPASPVGENGSETHPETNPETGSDPTQDSVTQQNPADQTGTAAGPDTGTTAADGGFASSVATSEGLAFARQILQLLAGTQDPLLAALELRKATQDLPAGLSRKDKFALKTGAVAALGAPWLVLPVARRILRERLSSVLCVANLGGEYKQLAKAVTKHGEQGVPVSLALGGSAVLGPEGAERELKRLISLAQLPFVSRLLVDIGRLAPGNNWRHDARVTAAVTAARQLLEVADNNAVLVTFQATAYDDVRLLAQTATQLLQDTALRHVSFGVSVRAENPESAEFLTALSVHTAARSTAGGAPLEVRITCESTLSQESAASILSGLPVAVLESRVAREAAALQLLRTVFNGLGVRAVLASESAFLVAAALELQQLLATGGDVLGVELRAGVADTLAQVLVSDRVPVYTVLPLVENSEFDAAVPGLLRLLGEAADAGSAIAHKKLLDPLILPAAELRAAESQVLEQVLARAAEPAAAVNRVQDRAHEWDPTERDSALFYRPQDDANMANTGGLTAAVLGLRGDDETGEIVLEKTAVRTVPVVSESGFSAEPGTDVSLMHNRDWLLNQIVSGRSESEEIADQNAKNAKTDGKDTKGEKSEGKKAAGKKTLGPDGQAADKQAASTIETDEIANGEDEIALLPHTQKELAQRVRALRKIALASVANRDTLTSQFAAATRLHAAAIDSQINYLIDSARYFALLGDGMQLVRGATFNPAGNVLIVCNNPEFTGEALVALLAEFAAGNSTALVASAPTIALAKHLLPDWHAAGYPADSLQLHQLEHSDIARLHATHGYARALLLGDSVLQESVTRLLPGLPVQGRFEQIGVAAITPAADIDTAAADAITSAFTGGDNGLRQVRAIVALGSVYKSKRFRQQLADAARAVPTAALHPAFHAGQTAGHTLTKQTGETSEFDEFSEFDESSKLGGFSKFATITELADTAETAPAEPLAAAIPPLAAPPTATQLRLLTELDHGESWLLQPRQLDETGLRWSAGIKLGVKPDSDFWLHLAGLPLIGVTHARRFSDLQDACNTIGSGAVASLHSWDAAEIIPWLGSTRAASLLTNQPTVPGQVERVPSGAWRASGCGIAQLAGGPNHLVALGNWQLREGTPSSTLHLRGLTPEVTRLIELAQPHLSYAEFDLLRRAALSDELAWRTELGVARDTSGLGIVTNILRYWRVPTHVRFAENTTAPAALRVLAAAMLLRAPISVSSGRKLGSEITALLASQNIAVVAENDETWLQNITLHGPRVADSEVERIRLVGGDAMRLSEWLAARRHVDIWAQPVTMAGPVELLTFLREQAVSINHLRHGTHADLPDLTEWLRQLAR